MEIWQVGCISMRIILSKIKQKEFAEALLDKISIKEAGRLCGLSERTVRDWRRGKFTIDLAAAKILCKKTGVPLPKEAEIKNDYWYVALGAHKGAMACLKKYGRVGGDPENRKQKWREWWEKEGKSQNLNKGILAKKPFKKPKFSEELAEFVGILLGDGCISQNQITVTFSAKDENGYLLFVADLVKKLFDVPFGIYKDKHFSAVVLAISRTGLIDFLVKDIGMKRGNKVRQQVDIPNWIKENRKFLKACVRGLIDTDGTVFIHSYKVNNKIYHYKKIAFSNQSKPLITAVYQFFKDSGFSPRITSDKKDVRLDSISDVKGYFEVVGFHNPRYLNKYLS